MSMSEPQELDGITVPVEEGDLPSPTPDPATPPVTHHPKRQPTWEDVEKARREEKDKLYPRLTEAERVKAEYDELKASQKAREAADKKAAKEAEDAKKKAEEAELSARELIERRQREFEDRLAEERNERLKLESTLALERQYSQLQEYRSVAIAARAEEIMPQLVAYIRGNTAEEIDASIQAAVDTTNSILGEVTTRQTGQRSQQTGTRPTSPPVGPMDQGATYQTLSADELQGMSMEDYGRYRERLLPAAVQARRQQIGRR